MPQPDAYCYFQDIAPQAPIAMTFDRDYLLHSVKGAVNLQVGQRRWLLPPSFAAWIPADTAFSVHLKGPVTCCSILTKAGFAPQMPSQPAAFQMSVLTREMVQHCRHWGPEVPHPAEAPVFFSALLATCARLVGASLDVAQPVSSDPATAKALAETETRLATQTDARTIADAAGMSERTMQRKFAQEFGESWSHIQTRLRMIRAVELLSEPSAKVIWIAGECGYQSLSAFNRSFRKFSGTTPSAFRRRLQA